MDSEFTVAMTNDNINQSILDKGIFLSLLGNKKNGLYVTFLGNMVIFFVYNVTDVVITCIISILYRLLEIDKIGIFGFKLQA